MQSFLYSAATSLLLQEKLITAADRGCRQGRRGRGAGVFSIVYFILCYYYMRGLEKPMFASAAENGVDLAAFASLKKLLSL